MHHCLIAFGLLLAAGPESPSDGIYGVVDNGGRQILRNDGATILLGQRLGNNFGTASLRSVNNANSLFYLSLQNAGPVESSGDNQFALVIGGQCLPVLSRSDRSDKGTYNLSASIHGVAAAQKVADRLKIDLPRRRHPGHRLEVRFTPDKPAYKIGEPIELKMELLNVGDVAITFLNGGRQRGPRDNQFRFLAYRMGGYGKAVPDTGDPTNFGGIGSYITLRPGESFTKTVALDKWFAFTEPETYRVTGIFELELQQDNQVIWHDLVAADCRISFETKK